MLQYTGYFSSLYEALRDKDLVPAMASPVAQNGPLSDEDLLNELRQLLAGISTLEQYRTLIETFHAIRSDITLRFLYVMFQALVEVEERVWASQGYHPPLRTIFGRYEDLLLDNYVQFIEAYEREIIAWTKEQGIFDTDDGYHFVDTRNEIYTQYVLIAAEILDANFNSSDSTSSGSDA